MAKCTGYDLGLNVGSATHQQSVFVFLSREGKHVHEWGRGAKGEGERIRSRLPYSAQIGAPHGV